MINEITTAAQQIAARNADTNTIHVNVIGMNLDVDTITVPETIWDTSSPWVAPSVAQIHTQVSSSALDTGTVRASGRMGQGTNDTTIVDPNASFIVAGVAVGDLVIDDTAVCHGIITARTATTLTIAGGAALGTIRSLNVAGTRRTFQFNDAYRVVGATGTRASCVLMCGLRADGSIGYEYIVLGGMSGAPSLNTYSRIFNVNVIHSGSNTISNAGTITGVATVDGVASSWIEPNYGRMHQSVFTIPAGYYGLITKFKAGCSIAAATIAQATFQIRCAPNAPQRRCGESVLFEGRANSNNALSVEFNPNLIIDPLTDIMVSVRAVTDDNTAVWCEYDVVLVKI